VSLNEEGFIVVLRGGPAVDRGELGADASGHFVVAQWSASGGKSAKSWLTIAAVGLQLCLAVGREGEK